MSINFSLQFSAPLIKIYTYIYIVYLKITLSLKGILNNYTKVIAFGIECVLEMTILPIPVKINCRL